MNSDWSYALGNETQDFDSAVVAVAAAVTATPYTTATGSSPVSGDHLRIVDGSDFEDSVAPTEWHDLAAREAKEHLMARFEHLLKYSSPADLVDAGVITIDQWIELQDANNERHRQALQNRFSKARGQRLLGLRYEILQLLESESPLSIDELFHYLSCSRGSFRDELMAMAHLGLVYHREQDKSVRITECGHIELKFRRQFDAN